MDPSIDIHTRLVVIYHNPNEITTGRKPDLGNTNQKGRNDFGSPTLTERMKPLDMISI